MKVFKVCTLYLIALAAVLTFCSGGGILAVVPQQTEEVTTDNWPYEITVEQGTVLIYQPQLESYRGNRATFRAVVSAQKKDAPAPVFGVVWFVCRVDTDRDTRMVEFNDIDVDRMAFPNTTKEQEQKYDKFLEDNIVSWEGTRMSLDRLLAMAAQVEKEKAGAEDLQNNPPKIIFSPVPTELIVINGEPVIRDVENSDLKRVMNTPCLIFFSPANKTYYLKGKTAWCSASDVNGPWQQEQNPPESVVKAAQSIEGRSTAAAEQKPKSKVVPRIIVATEPTELILSEGAPKYAPIPGTKLTYLSNTESNVIMNVSTQKYYVLIAGRWFSGPSLENGPWEYVPSNKLPADFMKIPAGSDMGHVLAFVEGTEEAQEAVEDAQIPQTAAIKRSATITVTYDGEPKFEKIQGTDMEYAVNTSSSVIRCQNMYYCCDQAVWYEAKQPRGPWTVSSEVPKEIYTIPPSSPNYNVTNVHIYESTPTEVYTGYTAGYTGSYVQNGTVVYGTGYDYPGYSSPTAYYPAPVTYGYAPAYDPMTGFWSFTTGLFMGAIIGSAASSNWWGPCGYHHWDDDWDHWGHWGGDVDIDIDYNKVKIGDINRVKGPNRPGNRPGRMNRPGSGIGRGPGDKIGRPGERPSPLAGRDNIYNRKDNLARNADIRKDRPAAGKSPLQKGPQDTRREKKPDVKQAKLDKRGASGKQQNNLFADRDGNVYRKSDKGWEQRDQNKWSNPAKDQNTRKNFENKKPSLDRDNKARQRGAERTKNFERSRSSGHKKSGSGMSRGGSGGRSRGGGGRGRR
jgi:hypothetical protein